MSRRNTLTTVQGKPRPKKLLDTANMVILCFVVVAVTGFFWLLRTPAEIQQAATTTTEYHPGQMPAWIMNLRSISGRMRDYRSNSAWLVENVSMNEQDASRLDKERQAAAYLLTRMNAALKDNSVIPSVAKLRTEFEGKFMTDFYIPSVDVTRFVTIGPNLKPPPRYMEVCFFPERAQNSRRIHGQLLEYDPEWRALMVGALEYPDRAWFDALMLHELYHAFADRRGEPSAHSESMSDLWISEELGAHNLELSVLDKQTHGQFLRRLRAVVSNLQPVSLEDLFGRLSFDSVRSLDALFINGGKREGNVRDSEYFLSLAETWVGEKYSGDELKKQQIQSYRFVARLSGP